MNALAPEHLHDLKASGLTDDTIAALQFESVRPADIPVRNAVSAYELPYFNLDGSLNCFRRVKLIPAVKDDEGHTQKYWQSPGSQPGLYLPPSFFNWQTVATNVRTAITITEGEKKAGAGCQAGMITAGVGGVWNWTTTLRNGDRLVLPAFDAFQWMNRPVLMCPDSDGWREAKEFHVLAGFFALAKALQHRGATVRFVVLPDMNGTRAGLDDWLLVPGNDIAHSWPKLERLSLDHERFTALTAWWQRWKEKQTTQDALKVQHAEALDVSQVAGLYTVQAPAHRVRIIFDRLSEQRNGVTAEVSVYCGEAEVLGGVDLGLKSDSAQTKLAGSLSKQTTSVPWKVLLQKACAAVLRRHRQGEPLQHLNRHAPVEPLTYTVNPVVFKNKITIVYGDGGLGKSTLALMLGMCVSLGATAAGIAAVRGRPLYLDYEDSADVHIRRVAALAEGHPEVAHADVLYQRCTEPLSKLTFPLVRRIQEEEITFVILDSLIAATGGEASAEATAKLFAALRVLGVEVLALGHVPKTQGEGQDHASVYGSVFNQNFARSVWEMKKQQDVGEDGSIIGLFNRKSNLSRLHHPIGLKVTQNEAGNYVRYEPFDLNQAPMLESALPLVNRIRNLLESDGNPRTAKQIADALGANLRSVQTTLNRYKGIKWSMIGENREALWTVLNR
jgi:hypothetical protein